MIRTDLDPATIARDLRLMAGDGSVEWVMEPIQAAVLLDVADALDENAKLREERDHWHVEQVHAYGNWEDTHKRAVELESENAKLRELAADMIKAMRHMEESAGTDVMVGYSPWFAPKLHELGVEVGE